MASITFQNENDDYTLAYLEDGTSFISAEGDDRTFKAPGHIPVEVASVIVAAYWNGFGDGLDWQREKYTVATSEIQEASYELSEKLTKFINEQATKMVDAVYKATEELPNR